MASLRALLAHANYRLRGKFVKDDPFLAWMMLANAGMLHPGNVYALDYAISRLETPGAVVEIGSFCGQSTNAILHLLSKHERSNLFVTADPWDFEREGDIQTLGDTTVGFDDYTRFVIESFKRNVDFFSPGNRPRTFRMYSDEFFDAWDSGQSVVDVWGEELELGGAIAVAFIDGNHTYEFCRRDFENVDRRLERGGWILFDDTADYAAFGLDRLMTEVRKDSRYELVMKNPNYLFRKR
jgi:hypothetical protein